MSVVAPVVAGARPVRKIVGIGQFAVSKDPAGQIVTHALGSCIAVCIWDPRTRVGGLLHFLLPDSALNRARAEAEPATFADTGLPLLFHTAYELGLDKARCRVRLVGGAEVMGLGGVGSLNVGKRNALAARNILWRNGLLVHGEVTGGHVPRSVIMTIADGRVVVTCGTQIVQTL